MPIATTQQYAAMLDAAQQGDYAYPAVNVTSITTINAALKAFSDAKSDGIIQFSTGGGQFASGLNVKDSVYGCIVLAEAAHRLAEKHDILIGLHTDHCQPEAAEGFLKPLIAETAKRREAGLTNAWNGSSWGMSYPADATLSTTLAVDYDALIIPAGAKHVTTLSGEAHAKRIIGAFARENMPILMIGDGADMLALVDITPPKIDDATGVGVDGPLAVATIEAAEAGLEALNQAMVADGESVAA